METPLYIYLIDLKPVNIFLPNYYWNSSVTCPDLSITIFKATFLLSVCHSCVQTTLLLIANDKSIHLPILPPPRTRLISAGAQWCVISKVIGRIVVTTEGAGRRFCLCVRLSAISTCNGVTQQGLGTGNLRRLYVSFEIKTALVWIFFSQNWHPDMVANSF